MDWGCILQVFQGLLNLSVTLSIIVVTFLIAWAGLMFIMNPANPANRQKARNRLLNAVLGMVLIFGSWMLVDTIMKVLYNPDTAFNGQTFGPWNAIFDNTNASECVKVNLHPGILNDGSLATTIGNVLNPGTGSSSTGGTATGSCQVPKGGPCTPSNLAGAFGSAATQAAQICSAESGNNPQNLSRSDKTADGYSYSVGLFQINITNSFNQKIDGKNCSAAFSKPCQGGAVVQSGSSAGRCSATVVDPRLYQNCVAAAQNPSTNIAAAKSLYDGDWGRWSTSKTCNLPR